MITLTWREEACAIFGRRHALTRDGVEIGAAYWRSHAGQGLAHATVGGRYRFATARTTAAAIKALERQLDRESIGLFGVDVVGFEREPTP